MNDIPEMRAAFDGLRMERVGIKYTVGQSAPTETGELIIMNW